MARVTVEDCLDNVENRFELVLVASKRARQLANGKPPMLDWDGDKVTVMALREIADGFITSSILTEVEVEEKEDDLFMDSDDTATKIDGTSENKELSSDELLASQVEALLAASNDILSGNASPPDTATSIFETPEKTESSPSQMGSGSEADTSGFSADLLKSAFMNHDKQATETNIDRGSDNADSTSLETGSDSGSSDSEAGDAEAR